MNKSHGSPWDRGSADSYYGRPMNPHYWPNGTNHGYKVTRDEMTAEEIEAYYDGYEDNEKKGNKKVW